jgi:hypothetical protein
VIDVTDGFTSIEVASDVVPHFDMNGYIPQPRAPSAERRAATGARVTIAFSRRVPLPPDIDIRVRYDIAENGGLREMLGVPRFTHTSARDAKDATYHYRLSHWIPAALVMHFVPG